MKLLKYALRPISDLMGFHTRRKLILFISDDWGGTRLLSKEARSQLIKSGIISDDNRFNRYDTLESNDDMERLFEVLLGIKDHQGNHPVMTLAVNVANPDFEKIRESHFTEYHYEPFTKTLDRYQNHNKVFSLYKKGIGLKIIQPEFHGREHVNVNKWIEILRFNNRTAREAFDLGFWYLKMDGHDNSKYPSLAAAFHISDPRDVENQKEIVKTGAELFKKLFGYSAVLFIPPAQSYHDCLEPAIAEAGFSMIDVPRLRKMPLRRGPSSKRIHFLGQRSKFGLRYMTRNCMFEPNICDHDDGVNACLDGIKSAFKFKKPAIISNHRAAFSGGIESSNREKGLKALAKLLKEAVELWPDAEFISASELLDIMNDEQ